MTTKGSTMTKPSQNRNPITVQQAEEVLHRIAGDARAVATVLDGFLEANAVPDHVAVSLSLRARRLLMEATDHLDTAVDRLAN